MAILDILVAFFASLLASLGVGGGGLLVIYLTLVRNTEQVAAQGINLFFFLFGALPVICIHLFKRKINAAILLPFCVFGAAGTLLGCLVLEALPISLLRKAFGVMLALSGAFALFKKSKDDL